MQQYNLPSPAEAEWMKAALYTKYSAPTRHEEKGKKKEKHNLNQLAVRLPLL